MRLGRGGVGMGRGRRWGREWSLPWPPPNQLLRLFSTYLNLSDYKIDAAGIAPAGSGLSLLLVRRRKQPLMQKWGNGGWGGWVERGCERAGGFVYRVDLMEEIARACTQTIWALYGVCMGHWNEILGSLLTKPFWNQI